MPAWTSSRHLWAFGPVALRDHLPAINQQFHWARVTEVASAQRPQWTPRSAELVLVIGDNCGGYNNCLGFPLDGIDKPPTEPELVERLARRHPQWSSEKIARAVSDSVAHSSRRAEKFASRQRHRLEREHVRDFLVRLTQWGPVTLLLTGRLPPNNEEEAFPSPASGPQWERQYVLPVRPGEPLESGLPPEYWTPIVVTSGK